MLLGVSVVVRGQANLLFSHSLFWPHLWRGPSGTKCLIFQIQHGDTYRRFSVAATALIRSNILVVFIHVAVMSDFVHCYSIWLSKNINSWLKGSWTFKLNLMFSCVITWTFTGIGNITPMFFQTHSGKLFLLTEGTLCPCLPFEECAKTNILSTLYVWNVGGRKKIHRHSLDIYIF